MYILNIYIYILCIYLTYLLHLQNAQMPAYERQGGEPALSEEVDFDSRRVGTISQWWLRPQLIPRSTTPALLRCLHCPLLAVTDTKFSLFPQVPPLPFTLFPSTQRQKATHSVASFLNTSILRPSFFLSQWIDFLDFSQDQFTCFFACLTLFYLLQVLAHLVNVQFFRNKYEMFFALNIL